MLLSIPCHSSTAIQSSKFFESESYQTAWRCAPLAVPVADQAHTVAYSMPVSNSPSASRPQEAPWTVSASGLGTNLKRLNRGLLPKNVPRAPTRTDRDSAPGVEAQPLPLVLQVAPLARRDCQWEIRNWHTTGIGQAIICGCPSAFKSRP
jgi:hypothetical protein